MFMGHLHHRYTLRQSNMACWKIGHKKSVIFIKKAPFSSGIFHSQPCLNTRAYIYIYIYLYIYIYT